MSLFQQLYSVLRAEQTVASQLLEILTTERLALIEAESNTIADMNSQKQPLLAQLEQLARQRESILQSDGFSPGKEGLEAFIANQPTREAAQLEAVMKQLRVAAQACRDNNQINGGIVNVNRQYLHKAMSVLRGQETSVASYGPGGEYTNQIVRQPLIGRV